MASIDELFTRRIPFSIKFADRENRRVSIQVSIELHTSSTPIHRKDLVVRLTDETDLFFLYTLHLSEEEFQSLKSSQGLLVDFASFPQKFIDLLELCLQEENKESPKFILEFVANGSGVGCTANLNVIETNPFKHLTHLSLKFLPGTDTDVKKYLANCLKQLKEQNSTLLSRLEQMESDLSLQLRQAREALASRTQELDSLKTEWTSKASDMSLKHRHEVTSEREKALNVQSSVQQRMEREKKELEQAHTNIVKQLETRLYELEAANKDLTDRKYKSESTIREVKTKLSTLEEEHHHARQELQNLRKNNAGLDSDYHEQEKLINQQRTRLAVMEQEIKDKDEVLRRTNDLYTTEQEQKHKSEEEIERRKKQISKLEASIKTLSEELVKGNKIIQKLQSDTKSYYTKLKLRNQVTTEQEKLLSEKNKEMEEIRKELEQAKVTLSHKDDENKKLNENLENTMQKLEESRQLLKTNENVINWLNKQVTENQLHRGQGPGAFEMNSAASVTGSTYRGIHNYSAPGYSGDMRAMGPASRLSTSVRSDQPSFGSYQPPTSVKHVHYQQQPVTSRPGAVPIAKSSPVGVIAEERQDIQASPVLGGQAKPSALTEPIIDSKYLQRSDEISLRGGLTRSASPTSIHFSAGATYPTAPSKFNPTRLSKDAVLPKGHGPAQPSRQTPPLASAYFPNQAKVT